MKYFFIALTAISVALISACGKDEQQGGPGAGNARGGQGGPPAVVISALVEEKNWGERVQAVGTARAKESIEIASRVSDKISRVHFESGDSVRAGQVLVSLQTGSDTANVALAQAQLKDADRQFIRGEQLAKEKLVSASQLDTLRSNRDAARARVQAAQATLADRAILAPFSGVLGLRQVSPGQLMSAGTVITTLDDVSKIKVDFSLPEVQLANLKVNLAIEARSDAYPKEVFTGRVISVDSRVDMQSRSIAAQAEIDNPDNRLRPGMLLEINVMQMQRNALVIPELALLQLGSESFVYRVTLDGNAEKVVVKPGSRSFGYVEIIQGLKAGDRIVVEGTSKLRSGQAVTEFGSEPAKGGDGKLGNKKAQAN
ncbi:MAG: efflux RND transporter periplasmic adaptor subunit [Arenimonas sp.]